MNEDRAKAELLKMLTNDEIDIDSFARLTDQVIQSDDKALRFSVDAYHIQRLGYELVGKQETALAELIKNAYDADASYVSIEFSDYQEEGGTLTIRDNGHGMSENTIRNTWMKLSTDDKEKHPFSPRYNRKRAGKKGIGRFAVQRLGSSLILETFSGKSATGTRVSFDWDKDYKRGISLTRVANQFETAKRASDDEGTKLIIKGLRDAWSQTQFDRVWRSILLLQPPFPVAKKRKKPTGKFEPDPGFSVSINGARGGDKITLTKDFLDHSLAIIGGQINSKGEAKFTISSKTLDFKDSHVSDNKYLALGKTEFSVHYFIYESDSLSGIAMGTARAIGTTYGGIRIYRDGFRVLPYGENEDDWLELQRDVARRSVLVPANSYNYFGHIDISSEENPLLEETSGREGLIENEAFGELQKFVRECVEWGALRVASERERKTSSSQREFVSSIKRRPSEGLKELIELLEQDREDGSKDQNNRTDEEFFEKLEHLQRRSKAYEEEKTRYEEMLRILASLGISIAVFSHEISGAVTRVKGSLITLEKHYAKKTVLAEDVGEIFELSHMALDTLTELGEYVVSLLNETQSRKKKPIPLSAAINQFVKQFKAQLDRRGIEFVHSIEPAHLRTKPMHQSEIASVLFNFLTNSMKAMEQAGGKERKISILAKDEDDYAIVVFQDTGIGIDESISTKIFDAFFTTTSSADPSTGHSVGLGLKIVSDIASSNGGFVRVSKPDPGYSTKLEFGIPAKTK